jgi:predicted molibdopterin-dependent oxidoreductase YjgC
MMASHPESCILCEKGNRCELRQIAADIGVGLVEYYPMPRYTGTQELNPFILRDISKRTLVNFREECKKDMSSGKFCIRICMTGCRAYGAESK